MTKNFTQAHGVGRHAVRTLSLLLSLTVAGMAAETIVTIRPEASNEALKNPLMGFRPYLVEVKDKEKAPQHEDPKHEWGTVFHDYLTWKAIEANATDTVEAIKKYSDIAWKNCPALNVKIVPRVYLDYPDKPHGWPGGIDEKDYSSPNFEDRLTKLIVKMGQAWDNDPRVAYVYIGIIGRWGEHHHPELTPRITKILGDGFTKAFKNKKVLTRHPFDLKTYNFGIYWDSFAHFDQSKTHGVDIEKVSPRWQLSMIGGETAFGWGSSAIQPGDNPDDALRTAGHRSYIINAIRRLHTNHVGWISGYNERDAAVKAGAAEMQKALGYRFKLDTVNYPAQAKPGEAIDVSFTVRNLGSSPLYNKWPVELALLDPATKAVVWRATFRDADVTRWMPGDRWDEKTQSYASPAPVMSVTGRFALPSSLPTGDKIVSLAILDPAGNLPAVAFAIKNYITGARHPMGYIGIGSAPARTEMNPADFTNPRLDTTLRYNGPGVPTPAVPESELMGAPSVPVRPDKPLVTLRMNDSTNPQISGIVAPAALVTIRKGNTILEAIRADVLTGKWSFTFNKYVTSVATDELPTTGTHPIQVEVTTEGGTSPLSDAVAVTMSSKTPVYVPPTDAKAPATPTVTVSGNGTVSPEISGTTGLNCYVAISADGVVLDRVTASPLNGAWRYVFQRSKLSAGIHQVTVTASNDAGTSPPSSAMTITIVDPLPPPAKPVVTITKNNVVSPEIGGTTAAGAAVSIKEGSKVLGQVVAAANGTWKYVIPKDALAPGSHTLTVTAQNAQGTSPVSDPVVVTVSPGSEVQPVPAKPVVIVEANASSTPTIKGRTQPGAKVTIRVGTTIIATRTADTTVGDWTYTLKAGVDGLTAGAHLISVTATSIGGTSASSDPVTVTLTSTTGGEGPGGTPPAKPVVTVITASAVSPEIGGTSTAGATITISEGTSVIANVVAGSNGNWRYLVPPGEMTVGEHRLTVKASNDYGTSAPSEVVIITVTDPIPVTPAPAKPVFTVAGNATATPQISGRTQPGAVVTIRSAAKSMATVTAAADDGDWTYVLKQGVDQFTVGQHVITVTATSSGGTSPVSDPVTVTLTKAADEEPPQEAPEKPSITLTYLNLWTVRLSGTTAPNANMTIWLEGKTTAARETIETFVSQIDGTWSIDLTSADVPPGLQRVTVTASTAVGTSPTSEPATITLAVVPTPVKETPEVTPKDPTSPGSGGCGGGGLAVVLGLLSLSVLMRSRSPSRPGHGQVR